jgi:hypothetical protein
VAIADAVEARQEARPAVAVDGGRRLRDLLRRAPEAVQLDLFADPPLLANATERRAAAEEIAETAPAVDRDRWARLLASLDRIRDRHGDGSVLSGGALRWADALERDRNGLVLRTSSLTR